MWVKHKIIECRTWRQFRLLQYFVHLAQFRLLNSTWTRETYTWVNLGFWKPQAADHVGIVCPQAYYNTDFTFLPSHSAGYLLNGMSRECHGLAPLYWLQQPLPGNSALRQLFELPLFGDFIMGQLVQEVCPGGATCSSHGGNDTVGLCRGQTWLC